MVALTLTPVAIVVTEAYELRSTVIVNACSMSFSFCAVVMTFKAIWLYQRFSTSFVLRLGSLLQLVGSCVRLLCFWYSEFWPILLGTILSACAGPIFINANQIIANKWFSDKERVAAAALQSIGMPLGAAISYGLTGFWFRDPNDNVKELLQSLILSQTMIVITVSLAL